MKQRASCIVLFALLVVGFAPRLSAEQGYARPLFNGENLDGWLVTGCEAVAQRGVLVLKSGNGLVRSEHRYGDFVLELEWRATKESKWDSGIYFRCENPPEGRPWPRRYQANLLQGREGDVGGLKGASGGSKLVKPGEWNHFALTAIGERAELAINGKPAWKAAGLAAPHGYIALQAEVPGGGVFEFRNIRITELGYDSLFNGKDLTGWQGSGSDAAKCWKVEDGMLMCTGQRGPWLRSEKQYDDFNLRFDYKLQPGGNSGVYLRVPENGAHRGASVGQKEAGVEVQLLDDRAEKYARLKPYQFCGSVYAIAPATKHVGREAGRWNSLEVNCRGTHYRVIHNGQVIVDAAEKEFPELKNRLRKGYLGLQNHSTQVWFRHLRIGPAVE